GTVPGRKKTAPRETVMASRLIPVLQHLRRLAAPTGSPAHSILDTLAQLQLQEPVAPCQLSPTVPRDLETICLKCLQKEPAQRYPSSRELADDLARYLNGEPIRARPVGGLERALRWMKRRPAAAALLGVIGLAIAVLAAVWVSFTIRLEEQRQEAIKERDRAAEQAQIAQRQTEHARKQSEQAARLLALTAAAVDDIAISARGAKTDEAWYASAGSRCPPTTRRSGGSGNGARAASP